MHSSRMRTARLLPVYPSMHCSHLGVYLPKGCACWGCTCPGECTCPGGVPVQGVYLHMGVYLLGSCTCLGGTCSGAVPARGCTCPGVYLPGGCTYLRGVPARGVYLPGGCTCSGGVYLLRRYLPRYSPHVNRMTDRCKNISLPQTTFAGGNNMVTAIKVQLCKSMTCLQILLQIFHKYLQEME